MGDVAALCNPELQQLDYIYMIYRQEDHFDSEWNGLKMDPWETATLNFVKNYKMTQISICLPANIWTTLIQFQTIQTVFN